MTGKPIYVVLSHQVDGRVFTQAAFSNPVAAQTYINDICNGQTPTAHWYTVDVCRLNPNKS